MFTKNLQYWVPRYQRRYIWDETNWKVLWEDIKRLLNTEEECKQHFTGTIVIRLDETASALQKREIIDGQQRLTTFQIIFCVIRDIAASQEYADSGLVAKLNDILELPEYDANREKMRIEKIEEFNTQEGFSHYRLILKGYDNNTFQRLVEDKVSNQSSGIGCAYEYFKGNITDPLGRRKVLH